MLKINEDGELAYNETPRASDISRVAVSPISEWDIYIKAGQEGQKRTNPKE